MRRIVALVLGAILLVSTVPVAADGASPAGSGTRRIGAPAGILTPAGRRHPSHAGGHAHASS